MSEHTSLYNGISKIAWGFIFILFHFKINTIDLLPDFVGYILIALGIGELGAFLGHTKVLKPLSIVLSIWTASVWLTETLTLSNLSFMSYLSTAMGIVTLIFNIILLTDLSVLAAKYQPADKNIDRRLIVARNIYAVCYSLSIGMSLSALLTLNMHSELLTGIATAVSIASGIAMLVIMIIILVSLFSLRKAINETALRSDYGTYNIPPFGNENTPPYGYTEAPVNEEPKEYPENKETE